ncbi:MAG: toll/interleukin-1 receptor domain-containing protein [Terriglobales bacterium]
MANPEHLKILKQGVDQWNKWREEHPDVAPDLREANLRGADLSAAYLAKADLRQADLNEARLGEAALRQALLFNANLQGAEFRWADLGGALLWGANLHGAYLRETRLTATELRGADLTGADLGGASLIGAELSGADFTHATAWETIFADLDLSVAKGLETIKHYAPSTLGIDTIYKSRGRIPEAFLRGCGVPDEFIAYIGSMVGRPIEFYSCFISYSTKDQEFAERLHADLQGKGVRCWFAPEEMKGGRKLHEQIDEAIRLHDKLLLILSKDSMSSEWVKTEIAKARKREVKEGKRVLFPVRLVEFDVLRDWECFDGDTGKDSAREIREYFIPDFSNWKDHDSYQTAFQRLVKDLKSGSESRPDNSAAG